MQVKIMFENGPRIFHGDEYAIAIHLTPHDVMEIGKMVQPGSSCRHACVPVGHRLIRDQVEMQLFLTDGWRSDRSENTTRIVRPG